MVDDERMRPDHWLG